MRKLVRVVCVAGLCFGAAPSVGLAQAATIAIYASSALDPNTAMPVANPVTYLSPRCDQAAFTEPQPLTNPTEGGYDDPVKAGRFCLVDVTAQIAVLPAGINYKGAVRLGSGIYGPFTGAFAVAAQVTHPCDGPAPTAGNVIAGSRTFTWCWDGKDTNGNPTTPSSWALYVNGSRNVLSSVTVGTTANAAGMRLYSVTIPIPSGTTAYEVVAVNTIGEAAKSATFTVTAALPATVPSPSVIRGVQ